MYDSFVLWIFCLSVRKERKFYFRITFCIFLWLFICCFHCRYPARAFVGDTFCYLSGMTFAVVGILGHFSKTLLLFFIPQIVNFLYSVPQLFHFVPCPRHRMPKYNPTTDVLEFSKTQFRYQDLNILGRICVNIFRTLRIIEWNESKDGVVTTNNFTLINFLLILLGPQHEQRLTYYLLSVQVVCTLIAFVIRYPLAKYFYEYWNAKIRSFIHTKAYNFNVVFQSQPIFKFFYFFSFVIF